MTEIKKLTKTAESILEKRYYKNGENWKGLCNRVSMAIGDDEEQIEKFFDMMYNLDGLPNSPTLMNAGTDVGMLSACFILPIEDDMIKIMDTVKNTCIVHKSGGGTGFDFSSIRPRGSPVKSTSGVASGALSFMRMINAVTEEVKQGGCFIGDTLIATNEGAIPIRNLKEGTLVYSWDGEYKLMPCTDSWLTKENVEVWKLTTDKGLEIYATPDHPMMVRGGGQGYQNKEYVKLSELEEGMSLMPMSRYIKGGDEWFITLHDGLDTRLPEHIWVANQVGIDGEHIHHKDGNHLNNHADNLVGMSKFEHASMHGKERMEDGTHPFLHLSEEQEIKRVEGWKTWYNDLSDEERDEYWEKVSKGKSEWNKQRIESGEHNFVTNHPSKDPELVAKAQKSRIATTMWKVKNEGLSIAEEDWTVSVKGADLTNPMRVKQETVIEAFGDWDSAIEYMEARNHKVVSVEFSHHEDVYNVEVPVTHNYVVCNEDMTTGVVVSNTRRGANLGALRVDHPEIKDFILAKGNDGVLNNFNISVSATDEFMDAVITNGDYEIIDPYTGEATKCDANEVFDMIAKNAHASGEPAFFFIDTINKSNPVSHLGKIKSSNPCGEFFFIPYGSCNLGSINLVNMLKIVEGEYKIDFNKLEETVRTMVQFLDRVIDVNKFPLPEIAEMTRNTRPIGLGVMGFADALIKMGIPYNSEEGINTAKMVMKKVSEFGWDESNKLGAMLGTFPEFANSSLDQPNPRNCQISTIAPTGTLATLAGVSFGIEPLMGIAYKRKILDTEFIEVNSTFEQIAKDRGFYSEELIKKVSESSSIQDIEEIPKEIRAVFVTAQDLSALDHVHMQAGWQRFCDNAISKTVNMPHDATVEDVKEVYLTAYKMGCKGVTVYRDGCRDDQVIVTASEKKAEPEVTEKVVVKEIIKESDIDFTDPEKLVSVIESLPDEKRNDVLQQLTLFGMFGKSVDNLHPKKTQDGERVKYSTGCGELYCQSFKNDNIPWELFLTTSGGGCKAHSEAIALTMSLILQGRATVDNIVKHYSKINCDACRNRETDGKSCPAIVAQHIAKFASELNQDKKINIVKDTIKESVEKVDEVSEVKTVGNLCPDCGNELKRVDGCRNCTVCGWTKCN